MPRQASLFRHRLIRDKATCGKAILVQHQIHQPQLAMRLFYVLLCVAHGNNACLCVYHQLKTRRKNVLWLHSQLAETFETALWRIGWRSQGNAVSRQLAVLGSTCVRGLDQSTSNAGGMGSQASYKNKAVSVTFQGRRGQGQVTCMCFETTG